MTHSLYLHPLENGHADLQPLSETLQKAGFLLADNGQGGIRAGDRLMEYITYLGCSPSLSSGGVENGLRLHRFDTPRWMGGSAHDRLRFPGCGHPIDDAPKLLAIGDDWHCPECGATGRLEDIRWRRSAARADLFLEIWPVFPREAVPSDALLALLRQASGADWSWFYSLSSETARL